MKWIKYYVIIMYSLATNRTIVNIFGGTFVVAGNFVKRIK